MDSVCAPGRLYDDCPYAFRLRQVNETFAPPLMPAFMNPVVNPAKELQKNAPFQVLLYSSM
jgi:hypothetical protein